MGAAPLSGADPVDAVSAEEYRSQTLLPLALGADVGTRSGESAMVREVAAVAERPTLQLTTTLSEGDSLSGMLARAGVSGADIARVQQLAGGGHIAPGTRFDLTLGHHDTPTQPRPLQSLKFRSAFDTDLDIERQGAGLEAIRHPLMVDATPLRIRGVVGQNLFLSAKAAGAPMQAIQQYLQAVYAHLSLDDLHPGATFDMVVAYRRSAAGDAEVGDLLYAGIEDQGQKRVQLLRWGDDGQFFDAAHMTDERVSNALVMPVAGARITSGYGMRYHPILGFSRMHAGTDLAAPYGSPSYAVADGVVTYSGWHGGHGNYVKIDHGGAVATGYGHMSRFVVQPGLRVHAGEVIGYVGSTGLSTGPHLHYEVFRNGETIDPMSVHFTVRAGVDRKELAAFRARLDRMMQVVPGAALSPLSGQRVAAAATAVSYR